MEETEDLWMAIIVVGLVLIIGWNNSEAFLLDFNGNGGDQAETSRLVAPVEETRSSSPEKREAPQREVWIDSLRARENPGDTREQQMRIQPEDREYVILKAADDNTEPVTISGWRIESHLSDASIEIGVAQVVTADDVETQPVVLNPGAEAIIVTGDAPQVQLYGAGFQRGKRSFRMNKCFGYLHDDGQGFFPSLPQRCPDPSKRAPNSLIQDPLCRQELSDIPTCGQQDVIPHYVPDKCARWIRDNANIFSCIEHHRTDEDFNQNEWRIFAGKDDSIWDPDEEILDLYNAGGTRVHRATFGI